MREKRCNFDLVLPFFDMVEITIYRQLIDNKIERVYTTSINEGCIYSKQIMAEDYIILKFSVVEPIYFQLGDYCDTDFGRFEIVDFYKPSYNVSTDSYDYELRLDAEYYKWKNKIFKYRPEYGGQEASWTLTDKIDVFMQVFLANLSAHGYRYKRNAEYTVVYEDGTDLSVRKPITFSNVNLIDALTAIAEQWECEWWIENQEIHLGKCQLGTDNDAIEFEDGVSIEKMTPSTSSDKYVSRLFVFGGTTNIPSRYRKKLIFDNKGIDNIDNIGLSGFNYLNDTARPLHLNMFSDTSLFVKEERKSLSYNGVFVLKEEYKTVAFQGYTQENGIHKFKLRNIPIFISWNPDACDNYVRIRLAAKIIIYDAHNQKLLEKDFVCCSGDVFLDRAFSSFVFCMPENASFDFETEYANIVICADLKIEKIEFSIEVSGKAPELTIRIGNINDSDASIMLDDELYRKTFGVRFLSGNLNNGKVYDAQRISDTIIEIIPKDSDHFEQDYFALGIRYEIVNIPNKSQLIRPKVPASYFTQDYTTETTITGVVEQHLMLPETWNNGKNYIDAKEDLTEEERVEGILILDDVYPKTECKVTQVDSYQMEKVDESTGEGTGIWDTYYLVNDDKIILEKEYILPNVSNFNIMFTSGKLSGMEFEINLLKHGDKLDGNVKLSDGTIGIYEAKGQMFHILANEKYGRQLPDNLLFPEEDDTFVLHGYDPDFFEDMGLVRKAEEKLLDEGQKAIQKSNTDPNTYTCPLYWWKAKEYGHLYIGQRIKLISKAYFPLGERLSRIIGFTIKLDLPYDNPEYMVGESAPYSRIGNIENKLNEITVNGTTYIHNGNYGNNGSVYIVKTGSLAVPSDNNVYSAKRSDRQYLRKDIEDKAQETITFAAGLISLAMARLRRGADFGDFAAGKSGGRIDELGNGELETLILRKLLDTDTAKIREVLEDITFDKVATFVQGLVAQEIHSRDWSAGLKGFGLYHKQSGKSYLEVDELLVRIKAIFNALEIRKLSYVGGNTELSAAGSTIYRVVEAKGSDGTVTAYRCYLIRDDGTTATRNMWKTGDMAKCQTFNLAAEAETETDANGEEVTVWRNVSNRYYWRAVTATGEEMLEDGRTYYYVDLANTEEVQLPTFVDGEEVMMTYPGMDTVYEDFDEDMHGKANDAPMAGDAIVQEGSFTDEDRQSIIRMCVVGVNAPSFEEYAGVNEFELAKFRKTMICPKTGDNYVARSFEIITENGTSYRVPCDRGIYTAGMECYYYDRVSHDGALWLCVNKKGNVKIDGQRKVVIPPSDDRDDIWQKQVDKGESGHDTFIANIDNEMTSIPLLEDGTVDEAITLSFSISAYYGLTDITDECAISLAGAAPTGWTVNTDEPSAPKITVGKGATPAPATSFRFNVVHPTYGSRDVTFSVAAIRAGGIGQDAVIYELLPSETVLYVARNTDGSYTPDKVSMYCGYVKRAGKSPAEIVERLETTGGFDGYNIYYRRRSRETAEWDTVYRKYPILKTLLESIESAKFDMVELVISDRGSLMINASAMTGIIDRETVPILTDGFNGENAINIVVTGGDVIFKDAVAGRKVYVEFFDGTERVDCSDNGFICGTLSDDFWLCDRHVYWQFGTDDNGKRFYYELAYDGKDITPTDVPFTVTDRRTGIKYSRSIRISNVSDSLTVTLSPEAVILTQSPVDNSIDLQPACTQVKVYKGMTDVTSDATISISGTDGCTAGKPSPDFVVVGSLIGQPDTGSVSISVTYKGLTVTRTFNFVVNYLGKFKETIENDVKTQIASKEFSYFDEDGGVHTVKGISEIVQSSDEISQRVDKVEDGLKTATSEIVQQADRITLGVYGQNMTVLLSEVQINVSPLLDVVLALSDSIKAGDEIAITGKTTVTGSSAKIAFTLPNGETITKDVATGEGVPLSVSKIITAYTKVDTTLTISCDGDVVIKNLTVVKRESIGNGLNRTGIDISNGTIHLQAQNTVIDNDVTVGSLQTIPTTEGAYAKLSGGQLAFFGWNTFPSIVVGVDKDNGCAILRFYDSGGRPMYNLGPGGLSSIVNTAMADSWSDGVDCIKTRNGQKSDVVIRPIPGVKYISEWSGTTYYQFNEGRFESETGNPVLAYDGRFDGKWYSTTEVKGDSYGEHRGEPVSEDNLIHDGWYGCEERFDGYFMNGRYPRTAIVKMRKFKDGKCVGIKDMTFAMYYYLSDKEQPPIARPMDAEMGEPVMTSSVAAKTGEVMRPEDPLPMLSYVWLESIEPGTVTGLE